MAEAVHTGSSVGGPVSQRIVLSPRSANPGARPAPAQGATVVTPTPQAEASPTLVTPKNQPLSPEAKTRKRAAIALFCVLVALLILAVLAYTWDSISGRVFSGTLFPATTSHSSPPIYQASRAQGAQDNARAETTENRRADREKCLETLRLRRVVTEVAQDTCNKMVQGIYH